MERFEDFKKEILLRAKNAHACEPEYIRAYKSETFEELMQVVKDNFSFACEYKVLDASLFESYKDVLNCYNVFYNTQTNTGYVLVEDVCIGGFGGDAILYIKGSATVENVRDTATVQNVCDNATVENVRDTATVQNVWGASTVENVRGSSTVNSHAMFTCNVFDLGVLRVRDTIYVSEQAKIKILK